MRLVIERNESIEATNASVKHVIIASVWKIEDDYECVSMCGRSWCRDRNKNTALAAEPSTLLDLVDAVEINMRGHDEGKIKINTDFRKS